MAKKRRTFTLEFKQEAVRLVRAEDMTYAQAGLDLGVNKSVIRDWCMKALAGELDGNRSSVALTPASVEEELARLRRENGILREEREILKKAALVFRGNTTDSEHENPIAPNLLVRDFAPEPLNTSFVGDITYLPTRDGWVYLSRADRPVHAQGGRLALADNMETSLCLEIVA